MKDHTIWWSLNTCLQLSAADPFRTSRDVWLEQWQFQPIRWAHNTHSSNVVCTAWPQPNERPHDLVESEHVSSACPSWPFWNVKVRVPRTVTRTFLRGFRTFGVCFALMWNIWQLKAPIAYSSRFGRMDEEDRPNLMSNGSCVSIDSRRAEMVQSIRFNLSVPTAASIILQTDEEKNVRQSAKRSWLLNYLAFILP